MPSRAWPQVRAGLIALAIALGLVDGCPLPDRAHERPWNREIVAVMRPVRRAVLRPFRWVGEGARFTQRWALFSAASRQRFRLEVQGRRADGSWELLYRAGDAAHHAYARDLEDERVRGAWAPTERPQDRYQDFGHWLGRRILADHPEYDVIRLWMERVELDRGEVRGTGAYFIRVDTKRGDA